VLEQLSAFTWSQAPQVAPPVPQVPSAGELHVEPAQQPAGHEVESQTHLPPKQRCPAPQALAPPQTQAPASEQPSDLVATHSVQVAPPQQPEAQDTASQTQLPATQCCPALQCGLTPQAQAPVDEQASAVTALQATQAEPPVPQADSEGALQVFPKQQPV
jgi:hypothetical protein